MTYIGMQCSVGPQWMSMPKQCHEGCEVQTVPKVCKVLESTAGTDSTSQIAMHPIFTNNVRVRAHAHDAMHAEAS